MFCNRYCTLSPTYDRYNVGEESLIHALCDCPNSSLIWDLHLSCRLIANALRSCFFELFSWIHDHASKDELGSICATSWAASGH